MEIWKDIKDYEGLYRVSNLGRITSLGRSGSGARALDKILKPQFSQGYYFVRLYKDKVASTYRINRLVAQTFIDNAGNKPEVNHIDGNKLNNNVENLEWSTRGENIQHALDKGLLDNKGDKHPRATLRNWMIPIIREMRQSEKYTVQQIADYFSVKKRTVKAILSHQNWSHVV